MAFKLQVVDEVEKDLINYKKSHLKYGIQGQYTVLKWVRKHGQLNWKNGMYVNKKKTPYSEIQESKVIIKQLEKDSTQYCYRCSR